MNSRLLVFALCSLLFLPAKAELTPPRDSVPEDHLAWFSLRGPVAEVVEYDYNNYGKTLWRFDTRGRLTEYYEYTHPFFENGGCVFGLWAHYRYAYDKKGKIQFLETYNADHNTVDEWADLTLELFPPQYKGANFRDKAEKEYGDTTFCFSQWTPDGETSNYFGIRYDRYGNWIEEVHTSEDGYTCAGVIVREIKYYKDIELFDLPAGVKAVSHQWKSDGRNWGNRYEFDREGYMTSFRSWVDDEPLYEWTPEDEELGSDFIVPEAQTANHNPPISRSIEYWSAATLGELKTLPADVDPKDAFYLCFHYMGYVFEGNLYPLHNGWWIVMDHWCLDEEETMYLDETDENGDPIPAASRYKDPFAGIRYPIIMTDSVGFTSRNYGGQTIKMYKESDGKKLWDKLKVSCHLDVVDADPKTRRLLCRTNPNNWDWDETPQYYAVYGWMDEEWVCANLLTTCP